MPRRLRFLLVCLFVALLGGQQAGYAHLYSHVGDTPGRGHVGFALIFIPPYLAYAQGRSWRAGLLLAVAIGSGGYVLAFELALAFDQPFGPVCALVLVAVALIGRLCGASTESRQGLDSEQLHGVP